MVANHFFFLFLSLGCVISKGVIYQKLSEVCTQQGEGFPLQFVQLYPEKVVFDWDVIQAFKEGRFLGAGSFGQVRKVDYYVNGVDHKRIALKYVKIQSADDRDQMLVEISALKAFSASKYAPVLYGCATEGSARVFLAQTFLDHNLEQTSFTSAVKFQTCRESLGLYLEMFKGIRDLWSVGFVHNDIKPANMMTDENNEHVYLIDFGLAQLNTDRNAKMGTPIFMSPAKFTSRGTVKPKDDFYSIALSISVIEAPRGMDDIFSYYGRPMPSSCFSRGPTKECRDIMKNNAVKVLKAAGYGPLLTGTITKEKINFTTLISQMIDYTNFSFTAQEIIDIIERLRLSLAEKKDLDAKVLAKNAEKLQKIKALRAKYDKMRKADLELIKQSKKAKVNLVQQKISAVKVQAKVIDNQDELKIEEKIDQIEKNLEALDEVDIQRQKELEKEENRERDESIVYNEHKELFVKIKPEKKAGPEPVDITDFDVIVEPVPELNFQKVKLKEDVEKANEAMMLENKQRVEEAKQRRKREDRIREAAQKLQLEAEEQVHQEALEKDKKKPTKEEIEYTGIRPYRPIVFQPVRQERQHKRLKI